MLDTISISDDNNGLRPILKRDQHGISWVGESERECLHFFKQLEGSVDYKLHHEAAPPGSIAKVEACIHRKVISSS